MLVLSGLRIHTVPKVASTSISACVIAKNYRRAEVWEKGSEHRFMAVRHPFDRIASAWGYFTQGSAKRLYRAANRMHDLGIKPGMDFPTFLDIILDNPKCDQHVRPQADYTGGHEIDELVKLENLGPAWDRLVTRFPSQITGPIEVKNASDRSALTFSADQKRRAEQVYARDLELYENAT